MIVLIYLACVAGCYSVDKFRERQKDDPEYEYNNISPGWGKVCSYVRHNITDERLLYLGRPENFPLYGPQFTNTLYAPEESDVLPLIQKEHIKYVIGFRIFEGAAHTEKHGCMSRRRRINLSNAILIGFNYCIPPTDLRF